jgi:hypothetical protein
MIMYTIFAVAVALIGGYQLAMYLSAKADETAEQVFWANRKQPLIFEQPDATKSSQLDTARQYKTALEMMKKHGNKYLTDRDVFLWVWGADGDNTETDFARWQVHNLDRKKAVIEGFYALKAQAAAKANQTAEHARTMAGEYTEYTTTTI